MSEGQTSINGRAFDRVQGSSPGEVDPIGVTTSINQAIRSASHLVRAEIRLAQAEAKLAARSAGKHASSIGVFAVLAFFGLACLTASLVIGLGVLLDNYWLSSLIVGLVFVVVSAVAVMGALRKIRNEDLSFPRLRRSLKEEQRAVTYKLREVRDAAPRLSGKKEAA